MADDPWAAFIPAKEAAPVAPAPTPQAAPQPDPWAAFIPAAPTPITAAPAAFKNRMAQGNELQQEFEKSYSERFKGWAAQGIKEGGVLGYGKAALGTVAAIAAGIPEAIGAAAVQPHDAWAGKVYGGGLHKEDLSDDPNAPEPQDALIQGAFNMAMVAEGQSAFENHPHLPLVRGPNDTLAKIVTTPDGAMKAVPVGKFPPTPEDFSNAAQTVVAAHGPNITIEAPTPSQDIITKNLHAKWEEEGLHPAEVAEDAKSDAFLRHDLSSAAASPDVLPPPVSPLIQPLSSPGSLYSKFTRVLENKLAFTKDLRELTAPISTGAPEAQAAAKSTASLLRKEAWDWQRQDNDIVARFDKEQRGRLWDAGNEESEMRQKGETSEHLGWNTLSPEERGLMEDMDQHAQQLRKDQIEAGMVDGEGLPAYTPRMLRNLNRSGDTPFALNAADKTIKTSTGTMKNRKYLAVEDTEAAAKKAFGPDAEVIHDIRTLPLALRNQRQALIGFKFINEIEKYGNQVGKQLVAEGENPSTWTGEKWHTIPDNPAFYKWRPDFVKAEDGSTVPRTDSEGNIVYRKIPRWVHDDFWGPVSSIADQKFSGPGGRFYNGFINLKARTMQLQLLSPAVHNMVEFSRAMAVFPGKTLSLQLYRDGAAAKNNVEVMHHFLDHGLNPIRKNFFKGDITSSFGDEPQLTPGEGKWSAQLAAAIPNLFSEKAGDAVKTAIDKAGNFKNNTLLWDRISDLQLGMAVNLEKKFLDAGAGPHSAAIHAAYMSNVLAGSIPLEAMSKWSRAVSNGLLFSRSFTLGTLAIAKTAVRGLPAAEKSWIESFGEQIGPEHGMMRDYSARKAIASVFMDALIGYGGISLAQSALNVVLNNGTFLSNVGAEGEGYIRRWNAMLKSVHDDPTNLLNTPHLINMLSSTYDNDPDKSERLRVGTNADGSARYITFPFGRTAYDLAGWATSPIQTLKNKLSFAGKDVYTTLANDNGYGGKIYDPDASAPMDQAVNAGRILKSFLDNMTPANQIEGGWKLLSGQSADPGLDTGKLLGPLGGVSFSKGYPGGPAAGLMAQEKRHLRAIQDREMGGIKSLIMRGQVEQATAQMNALHIQPGLQKYFLKSYSSFGQSRYSPSALRQFYEGSNPEQAEHFQRMREAGQNQGLPGFTMPVAPTLQQP